MFTNDWPPQAPYERKQRDQVYFEGQKKNELSDMKDFLAGIVSDPQKQNLRKELIKKIISYTTAGVDTSRLYPEMVLASATKDIVEKRLVFLYLSIYSQLNDGFARMAINTFMKDSYSPDPHIRSLAIRHLSNLRFKGRDMYILPILKAGLADLSPYVKKSCVMGLAKIIVDQNRLVQEPIRDQQTLNVFYELIRDNDCNLVCTVLEAINEIEPEGIAMSKKLAHYLLGNLSNFGEYQLPVILNFLELYDPKNNEQVMNFYNLLLPRLKSSNAAVAISISKIYLKLLKFDEKLQADVQNAIRSSLISFINHDIPEIEFVVLKHIEYIITQYQHHAFSNDFAKFMLGGSSEPTYIKLTKIRIIQLCVKKQNLGDIVNQFAQYLLDQCICAETIKALSKTILRVNQNEARFIIKTLVKLVETTSTDFLCNHALPLIRNYLRVHPDDFSLFINVFYLLVKNATQDEARCAMIEIIGDYGELIEDAVELIAWTESNVSDAIQLSLLRANVKLFLKRPSQMLNVLSHMFRHVFTSSEIHLQIRDYAAFLYRGMELDFQNFSQQILKCRTSTALSEIPKQMLQFNSFEIIYQQKSEKWLLKKDKYLEIVEEVTYELDGADQQSEQPSSKNSVINVDSKFKQLQHTNFDGNYILTERQFEQAWDSYEIGSSITRVIKNIELLTEDILEDLFKTWFISVMATSEDEREIKIYVYCRVIEESKELGVACMEYCLLKEAETMTLLVKCQDEELAIFVSRYVEQFLKLNEII